MTPTMRLARASCEDFSTVIGLIDEAAAWLRAKGLDQWANPWPDRPGRAARVMKGLENGKTWIVWDEDTPAATVTMATRANPEVWTKPACDCDLAERAVYAHRLIPARGYSSLGLGAQLIDWAGLRARGEYGAKWIRIDVWTTNRGLSHGHGQHAYYREHGFTSCGFCPDPGYPSGALFQKAVAQIRQRTAPLFEDPAADRRLETAPPASARYGRASWPSPVSMELPFLPDPAVPGRGAVRTSMAARGAENAVTRLGISTA